MSTPTAPSSGSDAGLPLPSLILGGGTFGFDYNGADVLESDVPAQTIRACFKAGLTAIDTSPYYTISERVIGKALAQLKDEFPRESYIIISKAGRFPETRTSFDYTREGVRASVQRSCDRLGTTYLDGCYMHDVEFVADNIGGAREGGASSVSESGEISEENLKRWGLAPGDEGKVHGKGDEKVLEAMGALFELKREGKIKAVGFSGYPLPAMLRLARLVANKLQPLDIMQSYCHFNLHNTSLSDWLPLFKEAGVKRVISASPLSMGLLRNTGGQAWHPGSPELKKANDEVIKKLTARGVKLEDVALGFGLTSAELRADQPSVPSVIGLSSPEEVEATMRVYSRIYKGQDAERKGRRPGEGLTEENKEQAENEKIASDTYKQAGVFGQTWAQGSATE